MSVFIRIFAHQKAKADGPMLVCTRFSHNMGKSYTASSLSILQGLTAAKAAGCSGAM